MPTNVLPLGQLEAVDLRKAWPNEAANFTPWLAEEGNLAQLSQALGLTLQIESVEKQVGSFAADILAKDAESQNWVLIENQIEPTDHRHLGQLLTYAAGLDARTVIWIAESFRDEHRAALEFLNQATTGEYSFFAVQIELLRIGDSSPAPRFSIIVKPNCWNKQAQTAKQAAEGDMTEMQHYWAALIKAAAGRYPVLSRRLPRKGDRQLIVTLRDGDPRFALSAALTPETGLGIELRIDGTLGKAALQVLRDQQGKIEASFGHPLIWEEPPAARASRIAFYMPGKETSDDRGRWATQHEWMLTNAPNLAEVIRPYIQELDVTQLQAQIDEASAAA